jgi:hypothetical protein
MRVTEVRRIQTHAGVATATVAVAGEDQQTELARRPYRPVQDWKQAVFDALFDEGFPSTITWDPLFGCPCGCQAAFVLGGIRGLTFLMRLDPEGQEQFDPAHRGDVNSRLWTYEALALAEHPAD